MAEMNSGGKDLARFEMVLDTYGADAARWPDGERERLQRLVSEDERAAALLAEARALNRLMALAPSGSASPVLINRIVAAAVREGSREARVVAMPAARAARSMSASRRQMPVGARPAAALLAASFALGLYLGIAGIGDGAFDTAFGPAAVQGSDVLFDPADLDQEEML